MASGIYSPLPQNIKTNPKLSFVKSLYIQKKRIYFFSGLRFSGGFLMTPKKSGIFDQKNLLAYKFFRSKHPLENASIKFSPENRILLHTIDSGCKVFFLHLKSTK